MIFLGTEVAGHKLSYFLQIPVTKNILAAISILPACSFLILTTLYGSEEPAWS